MKLETLYIPGELLVVAATIHGPRGRAPARMLVDTGALMTTLSPEVISLVGYSVRDAARITSVHSAVGAEQGFELSLTGITALGFTLDGHLVNVFDLGHDDIIDGLIGMNFLNAFNFEVRPEEGRILAERIRR
jgi:predicted aspartyl protease